MGEAVAAMLLDQVRRSQRAWTEGLLANEGADQPARYTTIAGPFGGPAIHLTDDIRRLQGQMNAQFRGGTKAEVELIESYVSDDFACLVMVERSEVQFAGHTGTHPWLLRVTSVFQREGDDWRAVHRHADPLVHYRSLDETLSLMAGPPGTR
jgi:ketosteroid isomerase-like protein